MEFQKIHNKGQAQLFRNQLPGIPYQNTSAGNLGYVFACCLSYLPYYSIAYAEIPALTVTLLVYTGGIFFWTFTEYILHRFAFHHHPSTERGKRVNYMLHGNHHEYPKR